MNLTYNLILAVFLKYYYPEVQKGIIGKELISIVEPKYERLNDETLNAEFIKGKINVAKKLYDVKNPISYPKLLSNSSGFKKIFVNRRTNNIIKFILNKVILKDDNLNKEMPTIIGKPFKELYNLDFYQYIINLVMYAVYYTKHPISTPVDFTGLDEIHKQGINEMPHLFLEEDRNYLLKYDEYYKKGFEYHSKVRTILYRNEDVDFYTIYVTPDLCTSTKVIREDIYKKLKGPITTNDYLATFGKFTSIVAPGGFGKSMFLKHLFMCDIEGSVPDSMKANLIPIFVSVKSYLKSDCSIEEMLYREVKRYIFIEQNQFLADLKAGGFLLLFDGLDEIKTSQLEYFFDELNDLTERYPNNSYVTSSRPSEQCECLKKFIPVSLERFELHRAIKMINKLPFIPEEQKNNFCKVLTNGEFKNNHNIASIPLLLTLMFMIFKEKGKIPAKTYQFYEEAYNVLYLDHDKVKNFKNREYHTKLGKLELLKVIAEFCYITTTSQDTEFSESDIILALNEASYADKISPDAFIHDLVDNLNLLYLSNDKYHFVHRSFQEYFAAKHCSFMRKDDFLNLPDWFNALYETKREKNKNKKGYFSFDFETAGIGVFTFLREMSFERVTELIITPTINKLIPENSPNPFLDFLKNTFNYIEYGRDITNEPKSNLHKIIIKILCDHYYCDFQYDEDLVGYIEYEQNGYWMLCEDDNGYSEAIDERDLKYRLDLMTDDEKEIFLDENRIDPNTPEFYDYKVPVEDIILNQNYFKELINLLTDENSDFIDIYKTLIQYK